MSSLNIKNLFHDSRDVGKTIKSSKKYYVWEFVLNNKYHSVEVFHSKLSGKKKLALDAQNLTQSKSYSHDFSYSFKIEKTYFNLIQTGSDKFELRIDNRSFTTIMAEEKFRPKEEKVVIKNNISKSPIRSPSVFVQNKPNPRNNDANFFNDNDFEFEDKPSSNNISNNNSRASGFGQKTFKNPIVNQPRTNLSINQASQKTQVQNSSNQNVGLLIDLNEPTKNDNQPKYSDKALFSQLQFDNTTQQSQETYNHNQQIFNNLQIDFGSDSEEDEEALNAFSNNTGPFENNNVNLNKNVNQNNQNLFFNQQDSMGTNMNNYTNQINQIDSNFSFNPNQSNNLNFYQNQQNVSNNNTNVNINTNLINNQNMMTNVNSNFINTNNSSNNQNEFSNQQNGFKERILGKGLIDLDNLLEDNSSSQKRPSLVQNSYNFDLSGPKIQLNPSSVNTNLNNNQNQNVNASTHQYPGMNVGYNNMNIGYNQPNMGYGMPMNQNNMYPMNNPQMQMNSGMNLGYSQQQHMMINNNYNPSPNMGMNMNINMQQQQMNYGQGAPQNKPNNNRGSTIDFF